MAETIVKKRGFIFIGGYEPINAEQVYQRFIRELNRFKTTWSATAAVSPFVISGDGTLASWNIDSKGPNWRTETEYQLLCWEDFVAADFQRSDLKRLPKGIAALVDFILSGTAWRYFRYSARYGFFFLCPVLILAAMAAFAIYIPKLLIRPDIPISGWLAFTLSITTFIGLYYVPGRLLLLNYMLDDWIFGGEFARQRRTDLDERLSRFAHEIVARARSADYEEVIISAYSLGGALIMDVLDRALKIDPQLGTRGPTLWLMATGSSLLKVALHPKAGWLRAAVSRVANAPGINWIEYQTVGDVISFYNVNPAVAMGLLSGRNPIVQKVRIRQMLTRKSYRRFAGNFFRLHRQWVMGNEVRYFYDYFQICCGPATLTRRVGDHYIADYFREDGSYDAECGPDQAIKNRQLANYSSKNSDL